MYSIMWIIDLVFLAYHWINFKTCGIKQEISLFSAEELTYKKDPLSGALNYNWLKPFQAYVNELKGDCDKFATVWKWNLKLAGNKTVKRYSILPKNPFKITKAHVVTQAIIKSPAGLPFVCIFSLDKTHRNINIKSFVKAKYGNGWFYVKMPY